jgi:hypothetical protein
LMRRNSAEMSGTSRLRSSLAGRAVNSAGGADACRAVIDGCSGPGVGQDPDDAR